jgi:uncharacterized protein YkwD
MADPAFRKVGVPEVILKDFHTEGQHHGIYIENCQRVRLIRCAVRQSTSGAIWIVNCPDVELIDCLVEGAGNPETEHESDCVTFHQVGRLLIQGGKYSGGAHGGILIRKARGATGERIIEGATLGPCWGSLLTIAEGYNDMLIAGNRFTGAATAANASPASIKDHGKRHGHVCIQLHGDRHRIRDNEFLDSGGGLYLSCSETQQTNLAIIDENRFDRLEGHAIELQGYEARFKGRLNDTDIRFNTFGAIGGDLVHVALPDPGADYWRTRVYSNTAQKGSRVWLIGVGHRTLPEAAAQFPGVFWNNGEGDVTPPPPPVDPPKPDYTAARALIFQNLNAARANHTPPAPPLVRHPLLDKCAQATAEEWAAVGWWNLQHVGPKGDSWQERIRNSGYRQDVSLATAAEIGARKSSAGSVVDQWVRWGFDTHGKFVVDPKWKECGVGTATGPDGTRHFVTFGIGQGVTPPVDPPAKEPKLLRLDPAVAAPGQVVVLWGSEASESSVGFERGVLQVGGREWFARQWTPPIVTFNAPDKPGFYDVQVTVGGLLSNILTLEVRAKDELPPPPPKRPYRPPGGRPRRGVPSGGSQ